MNKRELLKFVSNLPEELYATPVRHEELRDSVQLDIRVTIPKTELIKNQLLKATIESWFST
jgi:hypothetical protein